MNIYNELHYKFSFNVDELLEKILLTTIKYTKYKIKDFDVNFVSNSEIKKINNRYRYKNAITDVISFRFDDNQLFNPIQGEIYICIPQARKQAQAYKHSFLRELSFLFLHGLLHLIGYDHIEKKDEEIMFNLQERILNHLGINN